MIVDDETMTDATTDETTDATTEMAIRPANGSALIEDGDHDLYAAAAEHFPLELLRTDMRGGAEITYLEGESIISRMNRVFVYGWEAVVVDDGINEDADECWARVRVTLWRKATLRTMVVEEPGGEGASRITTTLTEQLVPISREQYGSQKLKRSRSTGKILDIGFDKKGALTDAIKKTVSLFGVALYLWNKEELALIKSFQHDLAQEQRRERTGGAPPPTPIRPPQGDGQNAPTRGDGRLRRPNRPERPQGEAPETGPTTSKSGNLLVNGVEMPPGFQQPFALVEQGKERNQCRTEQCPVVIDPNGDYTVGSEQKKGGYVMKRAREMAGTILCAPHAATWNRALRQAQQEAGA